jgi:DNA-binding transcriptional MerR regulator
MNKITDYLTITQAAEFLGVVPNTLRNWHKKKVILAHVNPINGYHYYLKEDLEKILQSITQGK